jgi:hypothetical protein
VIQLFLRQFRPEAIVTFRWSESCSKPRLDAYGGGVYAITAENKGALNISRIEEYVRRGFEETGVFDFGMVRPGGRRRVPRLRHR